MSEPRFIRDEKTGQSRAVLREATPEEEQAAAEARKKAAEARNPVKRGKKGGEDTQPSGVE